MDEPRVLVVVRARPEAYAEATPALLAALGPGSLLCAPDALAAVDRDRVDVALVLADDLAHQVATTRLLAGQPDPLPVLVEVPAVDADTLVPLIRSGASGVVEEGAGLDAVRRCLAAARRGEVVLPRSSVRHLAAEVRRVLPRDPQVEGVLGGLSPREREVVLLLHAGLSTAQVAARLFVSTPTVRSQLHAAAHKLGLSTREEVLDLLDRQIVEKSPLSRFLPGR